MASAAHLDKVLILLCGLHVGPGKEDGHQHHEHKCAPACKGSSGQENVLRGAIVCVMQGCDPPPMLLPG